VPDLPKLFSEHLHRGEPPVGTNGPFRQVIAELAREIGFVGLPEERTDWQAPEFSLLQRLRRMVPERG
jgi:hypothetical protein